MPRKKKVIKKAEVIEQTETSGNSDNVLYEDKYVAITADNLQYIVYRKDLNRNLYYTSLDSLINAMLELVVRKKQQEVNQFFVDVSSLRQYVMDMFELIVKNGGASYGNSSDNHKAKKAAG
jgi:hypothetical protein